MDYDAGFDESSFQWAQHEFDSGPIVHEGFIPQGGYNGEYGVEADDNEFSIASYNGSYDVPTDDNSGMEEDDYLHDAVPDQDSSASEDYHSDDPTYGIPVFYHFCITNISRGVPVRCRMRRIQNQNFTLSRKM
jgi:hypothetical protein